MGFNVGSLLCFLSMLHLHHSLSPCLSLSLCWCSLCPCLCKVTPVIIWHSQTASTLCEGHSGNIITKTPISKATIFTQTYTCTCKSSWLSFSLFDKVVPDDLRSRSLPPPLSFCCLCCSNVLSLSVYFCILEWKVWCRIVLPRDFLKVHSASMICSANCSNKYSGIKVRETEVQLFIRDKTTESSHFLYLWRGRFFLGVFVTRPSL